MQGDARIGDLLVGLDEAVERDELAADDALAPQALSLHEQGQHLHLNQKIDLSRHEQLLAPEGDSQDFGTAGDGYLEHESAGITGCSAAPTVQQPSSQVCTSNACAYLLVGIQYYAMCVLQSSHVSRESTRDGCRRYHCPCTPDTVCLVAIDDDIYA